jgi:3-isopropylmalate/(R)-2-methylmalate dehydratase small subunit
MDDAERGANATLTVDLKRRKSAAPTAAWSSSRSTPIRKHCLLNGLDDIGLTML